MNSCLCNEAVGLQYRWMRETPQLRKDLINWTLLYSIIEEQSHEIANHFDGAFEVKDFLQSKKGALGRRYKRAADAMRRNGFDFVKDSEITLHVKDEDYNLEPEEVKIKNPRPIMGRDPKFNIIFAKYVTDYEKALYQCKGITCGLDHAAVGDAFRDMQCGEALIKGDDNVIKFDWGYVEGDATSYESSQRDLTLFIQYAKMRRVFELTNYGDLKEFDEVFACKTKKTGKSLNGLKFSFDWCRGSGDMDTTSGNTDINSTTTEYFIRHNKGKRPDELVDTYAWFGIDAKILIRYDYHDVGFCSGKFIRVNQNDFHYVHDLHKLLRSLPVMHNKDFASHLDTFYHSLGYMYSVVYKGVPIYDEIAEFLMSCKKGKHYVDMGVLKQKYGLSSAFSANHDSHHIIDRQLALREIMLAFDFSPSEVGALRSFLSKDLKFPEEYCKKKKPVRGQRISDEYNDLFVHLENKGQLSEDMLKFRQFYHDAYNKFKAFLNTHVEVR